MDNILVYISTILTAIGGTGYFTFLFARRKYNADAKVVEASAKTTEIDNEIKISNYHKEMLDDLKPRYESQFKEYQEMMNRKFLLLEEEIKLKDRKIKLQQQEIAELKKENKILRDNAKTATK